MFHPWVQENADDLPGNGPAERLARLKAHLDVEASLILVGEAAGYQGCRVTGLAFTSERLVLEGAIPRVATGAPRLSTRKLPWSEPSATIVWSTLHSLGLAETTICWNAFPLHPYKSGDPLSNRTPSREELACGIASLQRLLAAQPTAQVVAVGKMAQSSLAWLGIQAPSVRHPAMGGATRFRTGLHAIAAGRAVKKKR
ncbi:MAG: uracil-DNA glycosylase [Nevskia sp.]|nr:uracil-DNA glycosylase [Nevskia sp.]